MSKRFSFLIITSALMCSGYASGASSSTQNLNYDNPNDWAAKYNYMKTHHPAELRQYKERVGNIKTQSRQNLENAFRKNGWNAVLENGWEEVADWEYDYQSFFNEETIEDSEMEAILKSSVDWCSISATTTRNGLFNVHFERTAHDKDSIPCEHLTVTRTFRYKMPSFKDTNTK
ncbi:hypothetical protein [Candidatus Finniella inopinata]|uniref:Uncharacterized protein n=1 Tax=Candidatus Finniella inopinata TaxID=1696036 RepID=A0A4Q7DI94_9PROT|nr:hypothetical protein [Candidatus Finniella inopinata]RZI46038.1 hypothetical protein EQU50_03650 [Candidatus Finniella inopinata]